MRPGKKDRRAGRQPGAAAKGTQPTVYKSANIQADAWASVPDCPGLEYRIDDRGNVELYHPASFGTRVFFTMTEVSALAPILQMARRQAKEAT